MPRPKRSEAKETDKQMHGMTKGEATKASGEHHTKQRGHLMEGIVGGITKRTMPPVIDGVVRGVPKYKATSMVPDMMHQPASATRESAGAFGAGNFPEGKVGR
jgi:hypothetical protein